MVLNPRTQYADDHNLRARQRLWEHQEPKFDLVGWVLGLADIGPGTSVLDVGCGNGDYLRALDAIGATAVGCDLSFGMLQAAAPHRMRVNADVTALPYRASAFDVVLAPHMLYHVTDRVGAVHELRRVLAADGVSVVVTNGAQHMRSLRALVETAVTEATPGWEMRSPAMHAFSLENGAEQLRAAFGSVTVVRPDPPTVVEVRDAGIAADYIASLADHYAHETARPWAEVVEQVRRAVAQVIDESGRFVVTGDTGAFVCR